MHDLINLLNAKQFKFSAKGDLGKKLIEYDVLETKLDLTAWPTSKEYKQMRLLLACANAIKLKEHKRGSVTSRKSFHNQCSFSFIKKVVFSFTNNTSIIKTYCCTDDR